MGVVESEGRSRRTWTTERGNGTVEENWIDGGEITRMRMRIGNGDIDGTTGPIGENDLVGTRIGDGITNPPTRPDESDEMTLLMKDQGPVSGPRTWGVLVRNPPMGDVPMVTADPLAPLRLPLFLHHRKTRLLLPLLYHHPLQRSRRWTSISPTNTIPVSIWGRSRKKASSGR